MIQDLNTIFSEFGIDYYVVGAIARDIHLSADSTAAAKRKTDDVDLAISINDAGQYEALKQKLFATGNFEPHPTEAIKVFYKGGIELDLLPFGEIEGPDRAITFTEPSLFIINMPGFREIYPFVEELQIGGQKIKVCTLEGIVLLKLISNNDRPQRTHDITDIEHIIQVYFDLYATRIYEDHFDTMDLYDTGRMNYLQLVCARVIGRKLNQLLETSAELRVRIQQILSRRPTALWEAMYDGMND
ncbi:putative nucleotidyltransferase [Mucilaginibacter yixingensis]|uniref:Putative nucleotidyltransferase n=2 Tax=Mucilaginibacter yixingensis TaxID=1295612 RepID=A0A2T5J7X8_9SPHI|nr:putative nucleotidyltransferase [Mucilaginibacter yixingensis]